jgi:hypothetical protein
LRAANPKLFAAPTEQAPNVVGEIRKEVAGIGVFAVPRAKSDFESIENTGAI